MRNVSTKRASSSKFPIALQTYRNHAIQPLLRYDNPINILQCRESRQETKGCG
jgi:hypothetical protein